MTNRTLSLDDYIWLDPMPLITPKHGTFDIYIDGYWITDPQGRIALYKGRHPQTNQNRAVIESIGRHLINNHNCSITQFPAIFLHRSYA